MKTTSKMAVGETETAWEVFVEWLDANGEATSMSSLSTCRSLESAMFDVALLQRSGYDREGDPIRVFKVTRERVR